MNPVAKTYYLFKKLGISKNERLDILLKTNGDLSQFEPICQLITNWEPTRKAARMVLLAQIWQVSSTNTMVKSGSI